MSVYEVSFVDGRFIESVTVEAIDREEAQESAIEFWEERGVVHGDLTIVLQKRAFMRPY